MRCYDSNGIELLIGDKVDYLIPGMEHEAIVNDLLSNNIIEINGKFGLMEV